MSRTRSSRRALLTDHFAYFERVIHQVCLRLPPHLRAEAESEAMVAMVEAADEWDADAGMTFRVFVSKRIQNRMVDAVRSFTGARPGRERPRSVSLDEEVGEEGTTRGELLPAIGPASVDPHERAAATERIEGLGALPDRWRQALTLDRDEAAEQLGVSHWRVDDLRRRARDRLDDDDNDAPLTDRELDVLRLIAVGAPNEEIGARLHLATETVKTHVKKILRKLPARSRAHAVNVAWEADWWTTDRPTGYPPD